MPLHHAIPKHVGGGNFHANLMSVTEEEHDIIHAVLDLKPWKLEKLRQTLQIVNPKEDTHWWLDDQKSEGMLKMQTLWLAGFHNMLPPTLTKKYVQQLNMLIMFYLGKNDKRERAFQDKPGKLIGEYCDAFWHYIAEKRRRHKIWMQKSA